MVDMTLTQIVFYRLTLVFQKAKVKQFFLAPVPTIQHNRSNNHNHPKKMHFFSQKICRFKKKLYLCIAIPIRICTSGCSAVG